MRGYRKYTEADRQLFAAYVPVRAEVRPRECTGGPNCWVERGPPAIDCNCHCLGCEGTPNVPKYTPRRPGKTVYR
jgi:hypothetical protein